MPSNLNEVNQKKAETKEIVDKTIDNANSEGGGGRTTSVSTGEKITIPIRVEREILPDENGSLLANSTLKVKVDVQLTGRQLETIQILESIDTGLEIINISKIYIANDLYDFLKLEKAFDEPEHAAAYTKGIHAANYEKNILGKDLINKTNNTFYIIKRNVLDDQEINNDNLAKKGRLVYWYYVRARNPGVYSAKTIVRTNEDYPDIDQVSKINIKEHDPRFKVDISGKKTDLGCNEKIRLTYNIQYLGGSEDPYICSIFINNSTIDYVMENDNSPYSNESFKTLELKEKDFLISYPKVGKYFAPDLYIHGADSDSKPIKNVFRDEDINVKDWGGRNTESITWMILLMGIVLGQIFGDDINGHSKRILRKGRKFWKKFKKNN